MNCHASSKARKSKGFTIIEVLIALVLLGILAAAASNSLVRVNDLDASQEADRLRSNLRYAQIRAQADTHPWRFVFTSSTTYVLGPVVIPGPGFTPSIIPETNSIVGTLNSNLTTTPNLVVRFDSLGRPLTDSGNLMTSDLVIPLSNPESSETIRILAGSGLVQ